MIKPNQVKVTTSTTVVDPREAARKQFATSLNKVVAPNGQVYHTMTADELEAIGASNSDLITMEITNTGATDRLIFLGTPLGVEDEYDKVPLYPSLGENMWTTPAEISDNQGANFPFLNLFNRRLVRHAMVVSQIEVVTDDTALGKTQRSQPVSRVAVPYNSADDSCKHTGKFIAQDTEYTGANLLAKATVLGDFNGIYFTLKAGATVQMNMYVAAIDVPNFKF